MLIKCLILNWQIFPQFFYLRIYNFSLRKNNSDREERGERVSLRKVKKIIRKKKEEGGGYGWQNQVRKSINFYSSGFRFLQEYPLYALSRFRSAFFHRIHFFRRLQRESGSFYCASVWSFEEAIENNFILLISLKK